jgi:hypothetical protein
LVLRFGRSHIQQDDADESDDTGPRHQWLLHVTEAWKQSRRSRNDHLRDSLHVLDQHGCC